MKQEPKPSTTEKGGGVSNLLKMGQILGEKERLERGDASENHKVTRQSTKKKKKSDRF